MLISCGITGALLRPITFILHPYWGQEHTGGKNILGARTYWEQEHTGGGEKQT